MCEDRCLYIGINVKARFPPTPDLNIPCDDLSRIPVDSYIIVVFLILSYIYDLVLYNIILVVMLYYLYPI